MISTGQTNNSEATLGIDPCIGIVDDDTVVPLRRALEYSHQGLPQQLRAAREHIEHLARVNATLNEQIDELKAQIAQVSQRAHYDELTGLPNRSLLLDRLNQAVAHALRERAQVGLVFIDLVGFKSVNDRYGHTVGDQLLQEVALRLFGCVRAVDTACRYGGDEFVIVLPELGNAGDLANVVQKIRACFATPFDVENTAIEVGASIGTALFPTDGQDINALLKKADMAMYRAKILDRRT
jgi:diguanylate cyclase (GGDEF)-like protein